MTSKKRFYDYLSGKKVQRIPNFNISIYFAAKYAGVRFGKFCADHKKLVESNLKTSEDFKFDVLNIMCDPYREVDDFGGEFEYSEMPKYIRPFLKSRSNLSKLKPFDPS